MSKRVVIHKHEQIDYLKNNFFTLIHTFHKNDKYIDYHWHNSIEITYVVKGLKIQHTENKTIIAPSNTLLLVNSGVIHDINVKKFLLLFISAILIATIFTVNINASDVYSKFIQNVNTSNTFGYVNYETDQFETYSNVVRNNGLYTSISSKIYKPISGDTLIVVFHGNGEGGVDGISNNLSEIV